MNSGLKSALPYYVYIVRHQSGMTEHVYKKNLLL